MISSLVALSLLLLCVTLQCDAQRVITAAGVCVRDADCKEGKEFCDDNLQCRGRKNKGEECSLGFECKDGLYCSETEERKVCAKKLMPFEDCDISIDFQCATVGNKTYKCSTDTNTCRFVGFAGDSCFSTRDCQLGFYCKTDTATGDQKCTEKLKCNETCGLSSDAYECEKICASSEFDGGVCTRGSDLGEPCEKDSHCIGHDDAFFDPNAEGLSKPICNIPKGGLGTCQQERDLIKVPGNNCDISKDACDIARGLSCRQTKDGPKCMFNSFDEDVRAFDRYCDLNSEFSRCNPRGGIPTECRGKNNADRATPLDRFFECLRKIETVPQGSLCNNVEYSKCESGTVCQSVPGLQQFDPEFSREAKFCVVIKQKGERCFNKFRNACANGLMCKNSVCVEGTPENTITHAYLSTSCDVFQTVVSNDTLPCVPGTVCKEGFCQLDTQQKEEGTCFSTALKEVICPDDKTCLMDENGRGLLECRDKFGPGATCSVDSECMSPLKCGGLYPNRQCFNPDFTLRVGEKCNPNATSDEKTCVAATDGSTIQCLPKGGDFVCQLSKDLYRVCDPIENIGCSIESNAKCNENGVCVPM